MSSALIAVGVAIVPMLLLLAGVLAMAEPGRRGALLRHPLRGLAHAMRADNADEID